MNKYFLLLLFFAFTTSLFAKEIKYHIHGTLKNKSNWAVEYANIGVFKEDQLVAGCSSNIDGKFEINVDAPGSYEIKISHLNYTPVSKSIVLNAGKSNLDLKIIVLEKIDNSLSEIVVRGNRKLHEKQARKDVFFISNEMLNQSGNVRDLLIQVPTIHVSLEDDISVEGDGDVLVLVNGRRYYDTNPLKLLVPEQIDKVEVNTTPSVDIVNEGYTSIVNIILKKDRDYSLNGNFDYVFPNEMLDQVNGALSYYTGRWRFFGGYKLHSQTNNYSISEYRTEIGSNDTIFKQGYNRINPRYREQYYGGIDCFIDDYNTLGLAANLKTLHRKEFFNELNLINKDSLFKTQGLEHQDYDNFQLSTFYKNQSKDEKKTLTLDFLYSNFDQNEEQNLKDYYFETLESADRPEYNELDRERIKAKLVYDIAIDKNSNLKFGVDYNNENTENYLESNNSIRNIEYDNSTYSGFVDYFARKGKLSYWLGLAQKYNKREISNIEYDNWCFYPNAGMSYSFTSKLSTKISYEKRVYHPSFYELDPYEYYADSLNVSVGNPYLKDYYSHNINLSGQYRFGRSYIKMNIFYQIIDDDIASVTRYSDQGVQANTYENLSKQKKLGIKLNYSYRPNKYFLLGGSLRGFWNRIEEKEYSDEDYTSEMLTYAYIYFPKDFLVFANYRQNATSLTYGGETRGYKAFSYGFSKKVLQKEIRICCKLFESQLTLRNS
ncbi:TonB-dependent receptor [Marinifilum sp.]|uniref:TonB-dependent receptor n=1 Tax=Marinifilum sp. TaxID=2033137 RepID=UPI003BA89B0A